jgi:hypothetical protein
MLIMVEGNALVGCQPATFGLATIGLATFGLATFGLARYEGTPREEDPCSYAPLAPNTRSLLGSFEGCGC